MKKHYHALPRLEPRVRQGLIFSLIAVMGIYLLFPTHAARLAVSAEAELGYTFGNAAKISDTRASGNSALKFGGLGSKCMLIYYGYVGKRCTSTAAQDDLTKATTLEQAQTALQSFLSQYNLQFVYSASSKQSGLTWSAVPSSELSNVKSFGRALIDEWSKYPIDFVQSTKLKKIYFVAHLKNFYVNHEGVAGPAVDENAMVYNVNFSPDSDVYSDMNNYVREVIHHEYDHLLTYNITGSFTPSDPTWNSYNPTGFSYGAGGTACNNDPTCSNNATDQHTKSGFVTTYATYAIEEDKAETLGYIMEQSYSRQLNEWIKTDPALAKKVAYYKQFLAKYSPEMTSDYYSQINP